MKWPFAASPSTDPIVLERIRPVEVPPLTEAKRYLVRNDVAGALLYAYPQVVADLGRAYGIEFPEGFSHEDLVAQGFSEEMRPLVAFFDELYRLYAPVRYGGRRPEGTGDAVLELLQSLYSPEPMWRPYVAAGNGSAPSNGSSFHDDATVTVPPAEG
ncbi:MAG TPA: hypothetical protein VGV89_11010 [Thermoplasmata archaeon]|nr:hypothetical protein [Thermoplasmata archaeon]